jgi:arylsulfatase A-like enzyme
MASHLYDPGYEGPFERTTGTLFEIENPRDLERARQLYDGNVLYGDGIFGRLLRDLEAEALLDRTVVVLTADHGEEFWEHGGLQHGRLFEEHVQIPLVIYHPDVKQGARSELLVSNVDLMPTLLAIAGVPAPGPLDGRDLTSLTHPHDTLVGVSMTGGNDRSLSIRRADRKLIQTCLPERRQELFDLGRDPREARSIAGDDPEGAQRLFDELSTILGGDPCAVQSAAVQGVAPTVGLDSGTVDALRALGYLEDQPPTVGSGR